MLNEATKRYLPVIDYFCHTHPEFILVGGTALALQKSHRISVDYDLFAYTDDFDSEKLREEFVAIHRELAGDFAGTPELLLTSIQKDQVHFLVANEVSVTLLKHHYPIKSTKKYGYIKLADLSSILAMKLYAIVQRVEYKDFYDIAILFQEFTLKQGIKFLHQMIKSYKIDTKIIINHLIQIGDLVEGAENSVLKPKLTRKQVTQIIQGEIKKMIDF